MSGENANANVEPVTPDPVVPDPVVPQETHEVKSTESELTSDVVGKWIETEPGRKFLQPIMDRRVTDALKTYKEGHYEEEVVTRVEAELLKRNPEETDEQRRLRKVEAELAASRDAEKRSNLGKIAVQYANAKNLNLGSFLDVFVQGSEEETRKVIDDLIHRKQLWEQQAVNRVMAQNVEIPVAGDEKLRFNSLDEIDRYLERNKDDEDAWSKVRGDYERLSAKLNRGS